jgi:hypothetical protein
VCVCVRVYVFEMKGWIADLIYYTTFSIKFGDWVCEKPTKYIFPELPNIDLSRDIKSVSEHYGQSSYVFQVGNIFYLSRIIADKT